MTWKVEMTEAHILSRENLISCWRRLYELLILAAFRYPHCTRLNSGPDQIILVLKLSTEPIRSLCCLHIHAKVWSAAAVGISGPISVS